MLNILSIKKKRNFIAFIWHSFWLALAETFAEKNTVLPGLILLVGGSQFDIGFLTSIMIGIPLFSQLIFASYLTNKPLKKNFLLGGVYLRIIAFFGVSISIIFVNSIQPTYFIYIIFFWMLLFAISGAFAGISYSDIVGKSFEGRQRKKFFVIRQLLSSSGILISAIIVRQLLVKIQYPDNYQTAFLLAGILLFIASLGFLLIKEKPSKISIKYRNIFEVIRKIPVEMKSNPNLKYFIISTNLIGFSFVLIPFFIGFIKHEYSLTNNVIGNLLLSQVVGMIVSNILWNRIIKIISFKGMLHVAAVLLSLLPIAALAFNLLNNISYFYLLFLLIGFAISAQKIAQEGVIIEISNELNRPLYIGIFGTLNLSVAFLPLILGLTFDYIDYTIVFWFLSILSLFSVIVINKMQCPVDLEVNN